MVQEEYVCMYTGATRLGCRILDLKSLYWILPNHRMSVVVMCWALPKSRMSVDSAKFMERGRVDHVSNSIHIPMLIAWKLFPDSKSLTKTYHALQRQALN